MKYKGEWVGFKDDEETVIVSGKTVREVFEKSQENGYSNPILFKVPTELKPYVGGINR